MGCGRSQKGQHLLSLLGECFTGLDCGIQPLHELRKAVHDVEELVKHCMQMLALAVQQGFPKGRLKICVVCRDELIKITSAPCALGGAGGGSKASPVRQRLLGLRKQLQCALLMKTSRPPSRTSKTK